MIQSFSSFYLCPIVEKYRFNCSTLHVARTGCRVHIIEQVGVVSWLWVHVGLDGKTARLPVCPTAQLPASYIQLSWNGPDYHPLQIHKHQITTNGIFILRVQPILSPEYTFKVSKILYHCCFIIRTIKLCFQVIYNPLYTCSTNSHSPFRASYKEESAG